MSHPEKEKSRLRAGSDPGGAPPPRTQAQLPKSSVALLAVPRRVLLEQTLRRAELLHSCEEAAVWLEGRAQLLEQTAPGRDRSQIVIALQKHKVPAPLP